MTQVQNIQKYDARYLDKDGVLVAIYIRTDKVYNSYTRQVYGILAWLGDVGGLNEALLSIGAMFVGFFA
jgi:hypothetical protein